MEVFPDIMEHDDKSMVKLKNDETAGRKVNSEAIPENMYDTVGLHHDYKVSTVTSPGPDNVYDEIELHNITTGEDIYEEVDATNIAMDNNVCYSSTLQWGTHSCPVNLLLIHLYNMYVH